MSQEKQHLPHPKRRESGGQSLPLSTGAEAPKQAPSDLNIDEFLSKDAEKFLKDNQQKGGE